MDRQKFHIYTDVGHESYVDINGIFSRSEFEAILNKMIEEEKLTDGAIDEIKQ
jgi:hypothetical protein